MCPGTSIGYITAGNTSIRSCTLQVHPQSGKIRPHHGYQARHSWMSLCLSCYNNHTFPVSVWATLYHLIIPFIFLSKFNLDEQKTLVSYSFLTIPSRTEGSFPCARPSHSSSFYFHNLPCSAPITASTHWSPRILRSTDFLLHR